MGLLTVCIKPTPTNRVIPFDRIHTDAEQILSEPGLIAPTNLVMKARVPVKGDMEEKAALEEAAKNLPRLYASPACRPQVPNVVMQVKGVGETEGLKKAVAVFGRTLKPCLPPNCIEVARK